MSDSASTSRSASANAVTLSNAPVSVDSDPITKPKVRKLSKKDVDSETKESSETGHSKSRSLKKGSGDWPILKEEVVYPMSGEDRAKLKDKRTTNNKLVSAVSDDGGPDGRLRSQKRKKYPSPVGDVPQTLRPGVRSAFVNLSLNSQQGQLADPSSSLVLDGLLKQVKVLETSIRQEFASLSGRQYATLLDLVGRMKSAIDPVTSPEMSASYYSSSSTSSSSAPLEAHSMPYMRLGRLYQDYGTQTERSAVHRTLFTAGSAPSHSSSSPSFRDDISRKERTRIVKTSGDTGKRGNTVIISTTPSKTSSASRPPAAGSSAASDTASSTSHISTSGKKSSRSKKHTASGSNDSVGSQNGASSSSKQAPAPLPITAVPYSVSTVDSTRDTLTPTSNPRSDSADSRATPPVTWHSHLDLLRSLDESEEELRRDTQSLSISPYQLTATRPLAESHAHRAHPQERDSDLPLESGNGSPAGSDYSPSPRKIWVHNVPTNTKPIVEKVPLRHPKSVSIKPEWASDSSLSSDDSDTPPDEELSQLYPTGHGEVQHPTSVRPIKPSKKPSGETSLPPRASSSHSIFSSTRSAFAPKRSQENNQ